MSNIIARDGNTDVRPAAVAIIEGQLLKLAAGKVTPITATADDIYGVALEDQAVVDADVSVLRYPFFGKEVRLRSSGDIAKDDDLEPVADGRVAKDDALAPTRVLFRALEAVLAADGADQLIRIVQHRIVD